MKQEASSTLLPLLRARFLLALFFDPEDGGDILLQNVDWLSTDYTALIPEDSFLHIQCGENLNSYDLEKGCNVIIEGTVQSFS
jgi:hypothetical protein